ncbi:MAG: hypothetical protein DMG78_16925 [Acidobacteria bacterium]|nr:MAG: hypothetical protein DMG78_16925 [Acidobacteriota bacterium]
MAGKLLVAIVIGSLRANREGVNQADGSNSTNEVRNHGASAVAFRIMRGDAEEKRTLGHN